MKNKTLTGILNSNYNAIYDIPCSITDTFFCNSNIYFCCSLSAILDLTSITINSGNISTFSLNVRIIENTNTPLNIINQKTFSLNSTNIVNNFLVLNITDLTNLFTHDYLLEVMSEDEIYSLIKSYKLSFRLNLTENISNNLNDLLENDFIQDLNLLLNTYESGPYDVSYKDLDILSPFDFTEQERISILENNPPMIGGEKIRLFYPKNISNQNKCPVYILFHGNNQFTENYDTYLSSAASYGYFSFSHPIDQNNPGGLYPYIIKSLDHIKQNITKINNGLFKDLINFNKINMGGHSRGGDLTDLIILGIQNKGGTFSSVQNVSLSISDFKSITNFGQVSSGIIIDNGLYHDTNSTSLDANANTIKYLQKSHNIPILSIRAFYDNQAGCEAHMHICQLGVSYDTKRNNSDKQILIFDNAEHSQLADYYFKDFVNAGPNSLPFIFQRNEVNHTFNSTASARNYIKSQIIYFLSVNNFNSNKIKKIRYIDEKISNRKINFNNLNPCRSSFYNKFSDIKYYIDEFKGITFSLAGPTGCTFTNGIGFSYGYGIDSDYFVGFTASSSSYVIQQGYDLNLFSYMFDPVRSMNYTDNDTFNGIMDFTYKSLLLQVESNIDLGYTFSTPISLSENDYICLRGALKYFHPATGGNTLDANFALKIKDINNNFSTLTSKNSSYGFEKPKLPYNNTIFLPATTINNACLVKGIYFRAGDFYLKNTSIGLTQINEITLQFGPDYGSTFAHLALDEFVVIKEL
jgi:hypothetical protein